MFVVLAKVCFFFVGWWNSNKSILKNCYIMSWFLHYVVISLFLLASKSSFSVIIVNPEAEHTNMVNNNNKVRILWEKFRIYEAYLFYRWNRFINWVFFCLVKILHISKEHLVLFVPVLFLCMRNLVSSGRLHITAFLPLCVIIFVWCLSPISRCFYCPCYVLLSPLPKRKGTVIPWVEFEGC